MPAAVAGHSLGEYTALVAAGGVTFGDAVGIVQKRGRYMSEAVPAGTGSVAALLGLAAGMVKEVCREAASAGVVQAANFNSPGQVVIAGEKAAVERAIEIAKTKGCKKAVLLPVSVPVHTPLMQKAADRLATDLAAIKWSDLRMPLINNAEAKPIMKAADIQPSLVRQLPSSVLWEDSIRAMINQPGRGGTVGMRGIAALVCALMAVSVLAGCRGKADTKTVVLPPPPPPGPKAIIKTRFGEMEMKFFPELAPRHVENFIKLAKSGFYNGTIFHRVIPGFMIQGGDPNTKNSLRKDTFGQGGPKDEKGNPIYLKAEFTDTPHKRGIVSMARAGEPDTAGSQFFIVVEDSFFLDRKYTVFGEVNKGLGIADKIAGLPRNEQDLPNDRIEMTVTIVE